MLIEVEEQTEAKMEEFQDSLQNLKVLFEQSIEALKCQILDRQETADEYHHNVSS
jgi:hypothetical protein